MSALRELIAADADGSDDIVGGGRTLSRAALKALGPGGALGPEARVAVSIREPLALIEVLAAIDGAVAALLLVSPGQSPEVLATLAEREACDALVSDRADLGADVIAPADAIDEQPEGDAIATDWLMTTSGTTGIPKIIRHRLKHLARTVFRFEGGAAPSWGLLYDMTRFAGMQVALQALIGGGRLIAVETEGRALADQVSALASGGCTHLSATPTLWRRLLMVPGIGDLKLRQATLGGETVEQDVLDGLARAFPDARLTHIYASTEAGVGFAVNDGRAGFPASFLDRAPGGVKLKIADDLLWLRPPDAADRPPSPTLEIDDESYICSGDIVSAEAGRVHFKGRESGLINVGGVKVYPETVERVIAGVPGVTLARVSAKKNPITGALVIAEVVAEKSADRKALKAAIMVKCKAELEREAAPSAIRFVDALEVNAAGKLDRRQPGPTT